MLRNVESFQLASKLVLATTLAFPRIHRSQALRFQASNQAHNIHLLVSGLSACSVLRDLEMGEAVRAAVVNGGGDVSNLFVASSLVNMYAKCGSMTKARSVFDDMSHHDVIAWNSLIHGYAKNGDAELALDLFSRMQDEGSRPDAGTFVAAIKACSSGLGNGDSFLENGRVLHSLARKANLDSNIFVANTLVDMYAKHGNTVEAREVFEGMESRSVVSWNALILGYTENGETRQALRLFERLQANEDGCAPNARTFVVVLKACSALAQREESREVNGRLVKLESLETGKNLHWQAEKRGYDSQQFVANTLIDMYAKCGSMVNARRVFDRLTLQRDVISWTSLVLGYAENGEEETALDIFERMQLESEKTSSACPNALTFLAAMKACSSLANKEEAVEITGQLVKLKSLDRAMSLHCRAWKSGYESDLYVANTVIDLYAKCGSSVDARSAFDRLEVHTTVSWNVLMACYVDHGEAALALELFSGLENGAVDARSFAAALKACSILAADRKDKLELLHKGRTMHSQVVKLGFDSDMFVTSSLVEMYVKCGSLVEARRVCYKHEDIDLVPWTSLMLGYVDSGDAEPALEIFARIRLESAHSPDSQLFVAALSACGIAATLDTGKAIHGDVCRGGLESSLSLANALVDFYGKSGSLAAAQSVFDSAAAKDPITWTSLLAAYSREGESAIVMETFAKMVEEGIAPDGVTVLCVLAACSHAGAVSRAERYFAALLESESESKLGVVASVGHYVCMVDLLCRANCLERAVEVALSMPGKTKTRSVMLWKTILGACEKWNNVELGKLAFDSLVELDSSQAVAYVLMGNIYRSVDSVGL